MSDDLKFGLSDLEVGDDLDVSMDNDTYQDQANPAPPAQGNYRVKALGIKAKTTKEGKTVYEQGARGENYPIFQIPQIEIVEGLGDGVTRKVGIFHDIKTKPFERFGVLVSGLGDLMRSYGTRNWSGLDPQDPDSGVSVLKEAFESGMLFTPQLDWEIYDAEGIKAALEATGLAQVAREDRDEEQKKLLGAIYNAGRIRGMKKFPFDAQRGKYQHVMLLEGFTYKHPVSGQPVTVECDSRTMEAKPVITKLHTAKAYDAGQVKIGAFAIKAPQTLAVAA